MQRSDEDPTIFEITYRGKHTCTVTSNNTSSSTPLENQDSILNTKNNPQQQQQSNIVLQSLDQKPINEVLLNLRAVLRVQTENLDSPTEQSFAPFHFPSTSNIQTLENRACPSSPLLENFTCPSYLSPATSGISHFSSVSPSGVVVNNNTTFGVGQNMNSASSVSQINDMIPAATSAANSPTVGLEFNPFDQFQNFTFDYPRFFS